MATVPGEAFPPSVSPKERHNLRSSHYSPVSGEDSRSELLKLGRAVQSKVLGPVDRCLITSELLRAILEM